jgi:hypothetical protein
MNMLQPAPNGLVRSLRYRTPIVANIFILADPRPSATGWVHAILLRLDASHARNPLCVRDLMFRGGIGLDFLRFYHRRRLFRTFLFLACYVQSSRRESEQNP